MCNTLAWSGGLFAIKQLWGQSIRFLRVIICLPHTATVSLALNITPTCSIFLIKETELSNLNLVCVAQSCQSWHIMN